MKKKSESDSDDFDPKRHSMGILGMDFERILKTHYFLVILASSLCVLPFDGIMSP